MGLGCSVSRTTATRETQAKRDEGVVQDPLMGGLGALAAPEQMPIAPAKRNQYPTREEIGGINDVSSSANECHNNKTNASLAIIHFNDVYNIEPRDCEPVGGAARFVTKVKECSSENPLVLFSGDCLNPSLMSTVTRGRQMIPILNKIGVNVALYGNHDFDFGVDDLIQFKNDTNFPWLLSNVTDELTEDLLAEGIEKVFIEWQGKKIGIIGLIEEEWLVTLATVDPRDVIYEDFVVTGRRLARELRKAGADLIIALTHMRVPNDERLLDSDADIDLILGGHDHHYEVKRRNEKVLVKSGTDFREFSKIVVKFDENSCRPVTEIKRIEIDSSIVEDSEIKHTTDEFVALIQDKMEMDLGKISVDLDGRFSVVRTQESNLGNFIADVMRMAMQTDVAIVNAGSLRSDRIHPAGIFRLKDLVSILPMMDILVVIAVTGETLIQALENGISQYPRHEGRFPQVSGVNFSFNPDLPPGKRIVQNSVKVNGQDLDWKNEYKLCVKSYIANGKDGYDVFRTCKKLVDEENGQVLPTIIQNHFESLKIISGRKKSLSGHKQSVIMNQDVGISQIIEMDRCRLAPKVEGRIKIVTYDVENKDMRSSSPKPRGRTSRLKSVSAPNASLMGLIEQAEDEIKSCHSDNEGVNISSNEESLIKHF